MKTFLSPGTNILGSVNGMEINWCREYLLALSCVGSCSYIPAMSQQYRDFQMWKKKQVINGGDLNQRGV